jgi:hypothetical protein
MAAENRKVIDCRWLLADIPGDIATPGNEEAVLDCAVQYAAESHGYRDTPALREQLRALLHDANRRETGVRAATG